MNYKDLSSEYLSQYKLLSSYIKSLKLQLGTLDPKADKDLYSRISLLYSICLDLKHVGEHLKKCERRENL